MVITCLCNQIYDLKQEMYTIPNPLKWYYDENCIFPIEAILKHKQVLCMKRKMLFTIFKYLLSF